MKQRTFISESQRVQLQKLVAGKDLGLRPGEIAIQLGIASCSLNSTLKHLTGDGRWSQPRENFAALLALEVVSDREARVRYRRGRGSTLKGTRRPRNYVRRTEDGQARSPVDIEADIQGRVAQAERARRVHEHTWLEAERTKYRLPERARPLSSMPI